MKRRNKVEEVKIENDIKSSRELTDTQKSDLNNLLNSIDREVDKTEQSINKARALKDVIKVRGFQNDSLMKRIAQATVVLVIMVIMIIYCGYVMDIQNFNKEYKESICDSTETKINIHMNSESKLLDYELVSASILGENDMYTEINNFDWVKSDIDTDYDSYSIDNKEFKLGKSVELSSLVINDTYVYVEYTNENKSANKEILLCTSKPIDIDTTDIQKKTLRFFEKSNPIMIKSYINSFNNSFLMVNEALGGGELNINTLENEVYNIESQMKTASDFSNFIISFDELGDLNITEIEKSPQIMYNSSDGVLRITDKEDNNTLYIFSVYNDTMEIEPEDLLQTNINNVFIHKQFDDEESVGYNTFAIITNNNMYCFKTTSRDLALQVLNKLGFEYDSIVIDKIQSVIRKTK